MVTESQGEDERLSPGPATSSLPRLAAWLHLVSPTEPRLWVCTLSLTCQQAPSGQGLPFPSEDQGGFVLPAALPSSCVAFSRGLSLSEPKVLALENR